MRPGVACDEAHSNRGRVRSDVEAGDAGTRGACRTVRRSLDAEPGAGSFKSSSPVVADAGGSAAAPRALELDR